MHAASERQVKAGGIGRAYAEGSPTHLEDHRGVAHELRPEGSPSLVMFLCNHCPYVKLIADRLGTVSLSWMEKGLHVVAVNSNIRTHPGDAVERMGPFAEASGWEFPYLADPDQEAARAFEAVRTPDLFLLNGAGELFYRGRFDEATPGGKVAPTGSDLSEAVELLLAGSLPPSQVRPGAGCSIKWISSEDA